MFPVDFAHISIFTFCMLFVLMYFMHIMYMLCFCTLCSYATCEWPEFYVSSVLFKNSYYVIFSFHNKHVPVGFCYTFIMPKVNLTK